MSDETTTLRDTFAAAALTGMLRKLRPGSVFDLTITARQAFEIADAMLRERAATTHDAAPAARAAELDRSPGQSPRGTGGTPTLTDAERKALERQASWLASDESFACDMMRKDASTLRGLLARLGGEW